MTLTSPSAILADTATGAVIFEKNADAKREVASITKLMTALLVLEALERGDVKLSDNVQVSQNAAAMKGSQALLDANATYSLEDLLRTTIMASANDSAVALSEYLCGSEEAFVTRMNARAKELGMHSTNYVNCTGYPQEGQYTTARDVCTLCCEVAKHPLRASVVASACRCRHHIRHQLPDTAVEPPYGTTYAILHLLQFQPIFRE